MKVLEATDFYFPWIAGPAPFIRNLSSGLVERGHQVVIVCPSPDGPAVDEHGAPDLHRVRTWSIPFGFNLRSGLPLADVSRFVRRWQPDVVHIHHPFPISMSALMVARANHIPIVATNHTIPECTLYGIRASPAYRPASAAFAFYIRTVLSFAARITTPTATAAGMLRDMGVSGAITPISNGVDSDRFNMGRGRPANTKPVILYTGRLDQDKDMETLVRAIPRVLERFDARVRIGGEGTDRRHLEALTSDLGISKHVEYTGYVPDNELPDVYRNADLYAISSPVELQSISTLEAMASGLPIVAVNAGALPELVQDGLNGFLSPPGDSTAFARAIIRTLDDDGQRKQMGIESRRLAERHSIHDMVSAYEQLLQSVVGHPTSRAGNGPARD